MTSNKESTRYYSNLHEDSVCKALNGRRNANSGAGKFTGGDVTVPSCGLLVECKTSMSEKDSFSIKKEWLEKVKQETFATRNNNSVLCFNFGPEQKNYYVIPEKLMKFLVEKLSEEEA